MVIRESTLINWLRERENPEVIDFLEGGEPLYRNHDGSYKGFSGELIPRD